MIKAIIFDVGGVVYSENPKQFKENICRLCGVDTSDFHRAVTKYYKHAQRGKIKGTKYPELIAKELGINKNKFLKNYKKLRRNIIKLNKDVELTILRLKKDYIIGTLTNIIHLHHQLRKKKNVYKHFKVKIISCEVGYRKPDKQIYKLLIKKLKLSPKEIVFIDDEPENLPPAKKLGINGILFKNNKQLVRELRKLGVKI